MRPHRWQPTRQEHWSGLPFPSPMHESEKWKWSRSVVSDSEWLMDCSLPGSSVHGIFQARVLEGVPLPSPCYDLVLPYLLLAIGSSFSCVLLTYIPPWLCGAFFGEPSFPALHGSQGSSCIFLFSPRSNYSSCSLFLKNGIETKFGFHWLSFHCWLLRLVCVF